MKPATIGALTWNAPARVEEVPSGFVTVTSWAPSVANAATLTFIWRLVPSGATVGLETVTMSPRAPPKPTDAPGANRRPLSVREAGDPWVPLVGRTAVSTGFVTLKLTPLLSTPPTATVTLHAVACVGTVTVSWVVVAAVTVAETRVPPAPANVTELLLAVALKPEPVIPTLRPSAPAFGVRLVMLGGGGGAVPPDLAGGADPPVAAATLMIPTPVAEPPSGLVTVTLYAVRAADASTLTTAVIVV